MVLILSLFGMICWGIAPVFGKLGLSEINPLAGLVLRTYLSALMLTGAVLHSGTLAQIRAIPVSSMIYLGIEGILATLVGDLAYYAALKYGEVSFVTLVMACSPLISVIISIIFLNEHFTLTRLIGTALIVAGLSLVMR